MPVRPAAGGASAKGRAAMAKTAGPRNVTAFTQWRREGVDQAGSDSLHLNRSGHRSSRASSDSPRLFLTRFPKPRRGPTGLRSRQPVDAKRGVNHPSDCCNRGDMGPLTAVRIERNPTAIVAALRRFGGGSLRGCRGALPTRRGRGMADRVVGTGLTDSHRRPVIPGRGRNPRRLRARVLAIGILVAGILAVGGGSFLPVPLVPRGRLVGVGSGDRRQVRITARCPR